MPRTRDANDDVRHLQAGVNGRRSSAGGHQVVLRAEPWPAHVVRSHCERVHNYGN